MSRTRLTASVTERLDRIATELEQAGRPDMALAVDMVSDRLEKKSTHKCEICDKPVKDIKESICEDCDQKAEESHDNNYEGEWELLSDARLKGVWGDLFDKAKKWLTK